MKILFCVTFILIPILLLSQPNTFTDPRDEQKYAIVQIDSLFWFSENLNFKSKNSVSFQDSLIKSGQWGRLYSKQDAINACPFGWRLPNLNDWKSINQKNIFALLDTSYWQNNHNHSNETGLSLQPSGIHNKNEFWNQYLNSTIWFQNKNNSKENWHLHVHGNNSPDTTHIFHHHKEKIRIRKFAVRCVKQVSKK